MLVELINKTGPNGTWWNWKDYISWYWYCQLIADHVYTNWAKMYIITGVAFKINIFVLKSSTYMTICWSVLCINFKLPALDNTYLWLTWLLPLASSAKVICHFSSINISLSLNISLYVHVPYCLEEHIAFWYHGSSCVHIQAGENSTVYYSFFYDNSYPTVTIYL